MDQNTNILTLHVSVSLSKEKRTSLAARSTPRPFTAHSRLPSLLGPHPGTVQRPSNPSCSVRDLSSPVFPRSVEGETPRLHAPCNSNHANALNPLHPLAAAHDAQSDRSLDKYDVMGLPAYQDVTAIYRENQLNSTPVMRHNSYLQALLSTPAPGSHAIPAQRIASTT